MINCDQYSEPIASDDDWGENLTETDWFRVQTELYHLRKEYAESLRTQQEAEQQ